MRAEVVGSPDLDSTDYGEEGLGAQFLEARRVTARTRNRQVLGIGWFKPQQLRQGHRPRRNASPHERLSRRTQGRGGPSPCDRRK